jgi:cytochrome oxidase assembly protein ShyY1
MVVSRKAAWCFNSSTVLLMLLAAALTLGLADWQWRRGQWHRAQLRGFASHAAAVYPLSRWPLNAEPDMSRVRLDARPLGPALLLENSLLADGRDGARVLQPYRLEDGSVALVDRGWLAPGVNAPPAVAAELYGRWLAAPRRFTLPGAVVAAAGAVDALDLAALARRWRWPLRAGVVVLERATPPLLPWPAQPEVDPRQNEGYALQWLLMSLGLGGAALRTAWKRYRS